MKLPFVSFQRYAKALEENAALKLEVASRQETIAELQTEIVELNTPAEATRRAIEEVEGRIAVAELELKLKRLREQPEESSDKSARPTREKILRVAAQVREQQNVNTKVGKS